MEQRIHLHTRLASARDHFRFISTMFLDPRPYANRREWIRRLESLATSQIEMVVMLYEDEEENAAARGTAPVADLSKGDSSRSYSEASLLPRLATWYKSKDVARRILCSVECNMISCPYTLGLGEAKLAGKPSLCYDEVCKPKEIHTLLKTTPYDHIDNYENQTLCVTHQIIESWIHISH